MFEDMHRMYVEWSSQTGLSSVLDFADHVFKETGVVLSEVLTDAERQRLVADFGADSILEGMDDGP